VAIFLDDMSKRRAFARFIRLVHDISRVRSSSRVFVSGAIVGAPGLFLVSQHGCAGLANALAFLRVPHVASKTTDECSLCAPKRSAIGGVGVSFPSS